MKTAMRQLQLTARLSPGAQAQPDDCGPGWVRGDHPGAPGGGAAVPAEAGADVASNIRHLI